jgi:hypothetical protein
LPRKSNTLRKFLASERRQLAVQRALCVAPPLNVCTDCVSGDATTVPFKQIVIAAGEGAKAALSAFDHLMRLPAQPSASVVSALPEAAAVAAVG